MSLDVMIATARSFYQGACRCDQSLPGGHYDSRRLLILAIACYAFSLEIYLKFLLELSTDIEPKEHDLRILYDSLDEHMKRRIETESGYNEALCRQSFDLFKEAFVAWRYFYEIRNLDVIDLCFEKAMVASIERIAEQSGYPYPQSGVTT